VTKAPTIFSIDSPKAIKAQSFGWLNAIHYLAPADLSGTDLCPYSTVGCRALCIGWFSGQAAMLPDRRLKRGSNMVRKSRIRKARMFMHDRLNYLQLVARSIKNLVARAARDGMKLCVRLNGSSDIAWEGIRLNGQTMFEMFPDVVFVDYTKNPRRFERKLPLNYCLTFSRSEDNEAVALELLGRGVNVAVVFAGEKPASWNGYAVVDGDKHDLRHLDPREPRGFVIGLSPKGRVAKKDTSGFVVRT
jgi:hypothetical protein